jgi:hypothetical protein
VDVRARKGYRSATAAEVTAARTAAAAPVAEGAAAVTSAISGLARLRPDSRFSLNAVPVAAGGTVSTVWVSGELQSASGSDSWTRGGTVDIEIRGQGGTATARATLAAGDRTFTVPVTLSPPARTGSLDVRARLSGTDPEAEGYAGAVRIDVESTAAQPLLFRRGPATGNRLVPAASFQFSRTERARLEFPAGADVKPIAGRLLDKTGQPLAIPVTAGERTDAQTGQRWVTADVTLAALAAGDYAVELTVSAPAGERRLLTAIRVGR